MNIPANTNSFIPEIWAADIQKNRTNNLVMANLVNKQYESQVLSKGDTVHIEAMDEFTTDTIDPATGLTVKAATISEQTLVIDQYHGFARAVQDMLKKQSAYDLRKAFVERGGRALATAIDTYLISLSKDFATKRAAKASLTYEEFVDAMADLDKKNVPQEGRALVINGTGLADLRKVAQFNLYGNPGSSPLKEVPTNGLVGDIYGVPVYVTEAVTKSGTAFQYLLLHKDCIAAAIQLKPEMEHDRDILKKADIVSGSTLFGAKVVRPDHGVVIQRTA